MWANLPYMWNAKVKLHLHSGSARLRKKAVEVSEALEKTTDKIQEHEAQGVTSGFTPKCLA